MSEPVNYDALDSIIMTFDLRTLGELAFDVVNTFCKHKGYDIPQSHDEDEKITEDGRAIALAAWHSVLRMHDRREFAASVEADLAQLG